jgi:hypothetical protein
MSEHLPVPKGLSRRAGALWRAVGVDYELSPAEVEVLRQALVSLDRADEAARVLATDGLFSVDRYGSVRAHPANDLELRHRTMFARLVAQLGIKFDEEPVVRRSPRAKPGPKPRLRPVRNVG